MDSKKNLLNEATVRRFMKLAELEPLVNPFVENIETEEVVTEDEEDRYDYEKGKDAGEIEGAEDALGDEEELEVDLAPEDELDIEDDLEAAGAEGTMEEKVKDFFDAVAQAATDILGVDTEVESDTGEVEDVEAMDIGPEGEEELAVADLDVGGEDVDVDDVELEEGTTKGELDKPDASGYRKQAFGAPGEGGKITTGPHKGEIADEDPSKGEELTTGPDKGKPAYRKKQNENNDRIAEEITRRVVERLLNPKA
jgi:hypothetical protein